jgi:hypothetical protein
MVAINHRLTSVTMGVVRGSTITIIVALIAYVAAIIAVAIAVVKS